MGGLQLLSGVSNRDDARRGSQLSLAPEILFSLLASQKPGGERREGKCNHRRRVEFAPPVKAENIRGTKVLVQFGCGPRSEFGYFAGLLSETKATRGTDSRRGIRVWISPPASRSRHSTATLRTDDRSWGAPQAGAGAHR